MGSRSQCLALHQTKSKHLYNDHFVWQATFKAFLYAACANEGENCMQCPVQHTWSHTPVSCSAGKSLCEFHCVSDMIQVYDAIG